MEYILVLIPLAFFAALEIKYKATVDRNGIVYPLFLVTFILVAGLRWKVGGDSISYEDFFYNELVPLEQMGNFEFSLTKFEPLFILFMSLCKTVHSEFWFFQLVHACIVNITFFAFFKKYTPFKFNALLIYAFGYFFYFNMEILREVLAICVFIYIYPLYHKKKWFTYFLCSILACFLHFSALILLFLPLARNRKLTPNGIILIFAVVFIIVFFSTNIGFLLDLLGQDSISSRYLLYSNVVLNFFGIAFNFIFFVLFPYVLYKYVLKREGVTVFEDLVFIYFLIAGIFTVIGGFGRLLNYFIPFMMVFYANALLCVVRDRTSPLTRTLMFFTLLIVPFSFRTYYYSRDTSNLVAGTRQVDLWYPYSSVFSKEEYPFREQIYKEGMYQSVESALEKIEQ